ncbi:MAG: hypothetical protein AB1560_02785 [Pseudomonadota bacterium]
MLNIVCKTDPISGQELSGIAGLPSVTHRSDETSLTIYFESEHNRHAYLEMPVEHPISELSVNLDNPTDDMIDEG